MRFGLFQTVQWPEGSDQQAQYRAAIAQALLAEQLGFDSVWMTEHHFTRHAITSDSLALLAHLAAVTTRVRLGTAVAVLPFHDPVRLAESAALVDHLSGGRLDFGIGRGYQYREYHGFGIELGAGTDRFEEALDLLLRSWSAPAPFAFEGAFHRYDAAFPQPKPLQQPHPPIWHATASDDGLRRCAENGWGVILPQGTPDASLAEVIARFRGHLDAAGRPYRPEKVIVARGMCCAESDDDAADVFLGPYLQFLNRAAEVSAAPTPDAERPRSPFQLDHPEALKETLVIGSPDSCEAAVRSLEAMGVGHVIFFVNAGGMAHDAVMASLRRFGAEVLPRFGGTGRR